MKPERDVSMVILLWVYLGTHLVFGLFVLWLFVRAALEKLGIVSPVVRNGVLKK